MLLHLAMVDTPVWVVLITGLGSGLVGSVLTFVQTRKIAPRQEAELSARVQQMAVETVEKALQVARDRISVLETQVQAMTEKIGELRGRLEHQSEDRERIREQLDLALVERAKLQQQIAEMNTRIGERQHVHELLTVRPADAIVMVNLIDGTIEFATDGVFALLGYLPAELVGQQLEVLVPDDRRLVHVGERHHFAEHPQTRPMGTGIALYAKTATGSTIPVDISLHPTGDGRVLALMKRREEGSTENGQHGAASENHVTVVAPQPAD